MDTVTYSKDEIVQVMNELFIPLKIDGTAEPEIAKAFEARLTPLVIAADSKKKTLYRREGYTRPEDFKQILRLMCASFHMDHRQYDSAIDLLSQILDEGSDTIAVPETLYLLGVARYKKSGDFQQAVEQWRRLKLTFPKHPLVKKVDYAL
jgi:thioredoxin-related protein